MRFDSLKHFVKLRRELLDEKAATEERLARINEALGELRAIAPAASSPRLAQDALSTTHSGKPGLSDAGRARIAQAQRERWARLKNSSQPKTSAGESKARKLARAIGQAARVPHT